MEDGTRMGPLKIPQGALKGAQKVQNFDKSEFLLIPLIMIKELIMDTLKKSSGGVIVKQGRIHGYPSCVRVGRGSDEIDQPSSWAGAITSKPPVNAEKA